jgi:hypothetical protein
VHTKRQGRKQSNQSSFRSEKQGEKSSSRDSVKVNANHRQVNKLLTTVTRQSSKENRARQQWGERKQGVTE